MSTRSGGSSHASKPMPECKQTADQDNHTVFICTARIMTPQLLRDMPVVKDAKGEFSSRYSLGCVKNFAIIRHFFHAIYRHFRIIQGYTDVFFYVLVTSEPRRLKRLKLSMMFLSTTGCYQHSELCQLCSAQLKSSANKNQQLSCSRVTRERQFTQLLPAKPTNF